ncbi:MAG: endonuclease V [Promethearchaeota archaeon]|nr:MAG: endonuclease V [Candidatus Lokiarchaeota archaeon]
MSIIQELLRDDYSFEQAEAIQIKYQNLINTASKENYITNLQMINTIVGLDVSYFNKDNQEYGIACAVTWNLKQNKKENHFFYKDQINFPYKPGFLGFRECKILAKVISKLPAPPDLMMCDGHGIIHPRRFGEAVHLGFTLNIPTIGVAKNPFFGYSDWQRLEKIKGSRSNIWAKDPNTFQDPSSNDLLGYAVCLNNGKKPVFISVGYRISLSLALKICLAITKCNRQPEPVYLADQLSRKEIKKHF